MIQCPITQSNAMTAEAAEEEHKWLKTVQSAVQKDNINGWISWSAYHAAHQESTVPPPAIYALLPLFLDSAHSVAMIRHSTDIVKAAVQHLNPGQVPIITADQPLYTIIKEIQWTWPNIYGEDRFVVMFGGLHIEMSILKVTYIYIYISLCYVRHILFFVDRHQ